LRQRGSLTVWFTGSRDCGVEGRAPRHARRPAALLGVGDHDREVAAGSAEPDPSSVRSLTHKKPVRAPLPAHLPRERVVVPAPPCCPCCGGKLVELGEDVTETLEVVPRQWKVIQTVREKFSCRACEKITTPTAGAVPQHPARPGWGEPAGNDPLRQVR
jgi:hypothetical protein